MKEGELKKEMRKAIQKIPVTVKYTDKTKVETGIFYNKLRIDRMIEEAKKEFPRATYGDNLLLLKDCQKLLRKRHEWFEKWFGE